MTFEERYIKAADRGEFQYEVLEVDDCTGKIIAEECKYKGKAVGIIRNSCGEFEIEIDNLNNDPSYIFETRSNRKSARELLERIIKNDESNNGKNLMFVH
jgi:hypothetical protein